MLEILESQDNQVVFKSSGELYYGQMTDGEAEVRKLQGYGDLICVKEVNGQQFPALCTTPESWVPLRLRNSTDFITSEIEDGTISITEVKPIIPSISWLVRVSHQDCYNFNSPHRMRQVERFLWSFGAEFDSYYRKVVDYTEQCLQKQDVYNTAYPPATHQRMPRQRRDTSYKLNLAESQIRFIKDIMARLNLIKII